MKFSEAIRPLFAPQIPQKAIKVSTNQEFINTHLVIFVSAQIYVAASILLCL